MEKEDIKALVRQVIMDMSMEYGIATEMTGVANVTGNVGGYDAPLTGKKIKRKLKDYEYSDDEDEQDGVSDGIKPHGDCTSVT